jgi:hypothetical protein
VSLFEILIIRKIGHNHELPGPSHDARSPDVQALDGPWEPVGFRKVELVQVLTGDHPFASEPRGLSLELVVYVYLSLQYGRILSTR